MIKVITTVGTSIFSNFSQDKDNESPNWDYLNKTFSSRNSKRDEREKRKISNWVNNLSDKSKISAEIKSLLKLKEEKNDNLDVYLLATDTVASSLAAEIVKEILEGEENLKVHFNPEYDVIKDLQVEDTISFVRYGLANLINRIENIVCSYYGNVVFNITGGYKGVIPYMTIMGIVNQCEIKYIYEDSEQLITIPQLPLRIDDTIFKGNYEIISSLENGIEHYNQIKKNQFKIINELEKSGLIESDGDTAFLSPIGQILFRNYKNKFVWFYATDEIFNKINSQPNILRILKGKFFENYKSKTELKNNHNVYDDGNNPYRIFYIERDNNIYIYKTFEEHNEYEKYLNNVQLSNNFKNDYIRNAKLRKISKEEKDV